MDGKFRRYAMVPAHGMALLPQNPSTGNGQRPPCTRLYNCQDKSAFLYSVPAREVRLDGHCCGVHAMADRLRHACLTDGCLYYAGSPLRGGILPDASPTPSMNEEVEERLTEEERLARLTPVPRYCTPHSGHQLAVLLTATTPVKYVRQSRRGCQEHRHHVS